MDDHHRGTGAVNRLADRVVGLARDEGRVQLYGDIFPGTPNAALMHELMTAYGMVLVHETPILNIYCKWLE